MDNRRILEYLGGIESLKKCLFQPSLARILEYLGGIERLLSFLIPINQLKILEYLGGIESAEEKLGIKHTV